MTRITHGELDLKFGYFYYMWNGPNLFPEPGAIVSDGEAYAYAEVVESTHEDLLQCPADPTHVTCDLAEVQVLECDGGSRGGIYKHPDHFMLTESLAEELLARELKGAMIRRIPTVIPQWGERTRTSESAVYQLFFLGPTARVPLQVDPENGNQCPFCGVAPLFCTVCLEGFLNCRSCGKRGIVGTDESPKKSDPRLLYVPAPYDRIIDARMWDGSDIFGEHINGFVTRRVVDLLVKLKAHPFEAEPVPVNVYGATSEQLERLETCLQPL